MRADSGGVCDEGHGRKGMKNKRSIAGQTLTLTLAGAGLARKCVWEISRMAKGRPKT